MSPAQRSMAFAECKPLLERLREREGKVDERTARMAITRRAIGREKSWGAVWGQKEFDQLIGVVWAMAHSDNLDLQMRQVEQPVTRAEASVYAQTYLDAICAAAAEQGDESLVQRLSTGAGRESYINGICRRAHKCKLADLEDAQWPDVLVALRHTWQHKEGVYHTHRPKERGQERAGQDLASRAPATEGVTRTGSADGAARVREELF